MDLSVIIVSWNVQAKLKNNLTALLNSAGLNFEVFVVDNASTDNTVEMIKNDFSSIKLIANKANVGFSRACNQAMKEASGRYILLLNPVFLWLPFYCKFKDFYQERFCNLQSRYHSCAHHLLNGDHW